MQVRRGRSVQPAAMAVEPVARGCARPRDVGLGVSSGLFTPLTVQRSITYIADATRRSLSRMSPPPPSESSSLRSRE